MRTVTQAALLAVTAILACLLAAGAGRSSRTMVTSPRGISREAMPARAGAAAFFNEGDPVALVIPTIGLAAAVGYAPLTGQDLDASELDKGPVLISSAAGDSLSPFGLPGVSLVLGHRQSGIRPRAFARLDRLAAGDPIIVAGQTLSLYYEVCRSEEVAPQEVWPRVDRAGLDALNRGESTLILMTCAPYGFNWRRLMVFAKPAGNGSPGSRRLTGSDRGVER